MNNSPQRKVLLSERIDDLLVVTIIMCCCWSLVHLRREYSSFESVLPRDRLDLLGAEYDAIARAIRTGRGFADPFEVTTGPTAWMAPTLPYLTAGLYAIAADDRDVVVTIVCWLQAFSVGLTAYMVAAAARDVGSPWIGYLAIIIGCIINFNWLFQRTHDVWLLLLVFNFLWYAATKRWAKLSSTPAALAWGSAGGMVALCSPIAGFTWAGLTVFENFRVGWLSRRSTALFCLAALTSIVVISPWVVRNRLLLQRWIPLKSNLAFEIWQGQCEDEDGVLDSQTLSKHPWPTSGHAQRLRFFEMGEVPFVEACWAPTRASIASSPVDFLERIANRFVAACIYFDPTFVSNRSKWVTVVARWIYFLPFACMVFIVTHHRPIAGGNAMRAAVIYILGLAPYVLVSYYQRYLAPLGGIQMLLVVYGLVGLKLRWADVRKPKGEASSTEPYDE